MASPVDRTAIWQDKLKVQNEVDPDGKIKQKIILLTGNRPVFMDNLRGSSIDSAQSIKVWLLPKAELASKDAGTAKDNQSPGGSSLGGGGFDIRRLLAFRDVHLLAPAKTMIGRQYVDAVFIQAPPVPASSDITSAAPANSDDVASTKVKDPAPAENQKDPAPAENQVAAKDEAPKKPSEPLMNGSADRIWVEIEMTPKPAATQAEQFRNSPSRNCLQVKRIRWSSGR